MQAIYHLLYEPGLSLKTMGVVVGLWLVASHLFALFKPALVKPWLARFARNDKLGAIIVAVCFGWSLVIWSCMDLGEFYKIERPVQMVIIGVGIGVILYVREFLAVRALGFLVILAAAPMLESAFLKDPQSRLLLVAFAYGIAVMGMFWVGMPYLLRDQVNWVLAKPQRYQAGAVAGVAYGAILVVCAVAWW